MWTKKLIMEAIEFEKKHDNDLEYIRILENKLKTIDKSEFDAKLSIKLWEQNI